MPPTIKQGSTGAAVREAQYLLARDRALGAAEIDGIFGARTAAAVREFQQERGLGADGIVGPQTWSKLLAVFPYPPPTLAEGSTGPVVRRLQQFLSQIRSDFDPGAPPLVADGDYGPKTRAMVVAFQHWGGVPADGVVGLQTWSVPLSSNSGAEDLAFEVGV